MRWVQAPGATGSAELSSIVWALSWSAVGTRTTHLLLGPLRSSRNELTRLPSWPRIARVPSPSWPGYAQAPTEKLWPVFRTGPEVAAYPEVPLNQPAEPTSQP